MNSKIKGNLLGSNQKILLSIVCIVLILLLVVFKNVFFQSTLLLKSFGKNSMDPYVALSNEKPTFIEFYAEWCEVCKKTSSSINDLKNEFEPDVNFVFLNVDNPKWEQLIKEYKVNGIPQINLFDSNSKLDSTFVGFQEKLVIKNSLKDLSKNNS